MSADTFPEENYAAHKSLCFVLLEINSKHLLIWRLLKSELFLLPPPPL